MSRREELGKLVRRVWVDWALEQPGADDHPSWLLTWSEIDDDQREVDMRIGEAIAADERDRLGRLSPGERDLVLSDLRDLLDALGLGTHARPESPHEVMQMAIAHVRSLRGETQP